MRSRTLARAGLGVAAALLVLGVPARAGASLDVGARPERPARESVVGQSGAGDGADQGSQTTDVTPVPVPHIIPRPNSGHAPRDAGDPGGLLQGVVLLLIVVGVGTIATLAIRESRRNRGRQPGRGS